jgi:hypothetical protein
MALSNVIQSLKDQLQRWRIRLGKLESGEMYCVTSSSSPNRKHDTEEWIKELKANIDAAEAALRELEGSLLAGDGGYFS